MILPIVAFGDPVLKREAEDIDENYPNLQELIDNMFETMYNAPGVGLAAPQVGLGIRLFIIDSTQMYDDDDPEREKGMKQVFINPIILAESGRKWDFQEGCLSIPGIREDVSRQPKITIEYYDRDWNLHEETFSDMTARVIQHEYDHVDGILFTDHLKPLKRRFLKGRLNAISKGEVDVDYKMSFPLKKKGR